jgi:hypothetical protein
VDVRFVLPLPPNRANDRSHWRKVAREKKAYREDLDILQLVGLRHPFMVPRPPDAPLRRVEVRATLYVHQLMDEGNALNRLKWLEDWLVTRGYIMDDDRESLRWAAIPDQIVDRKNPRVELTISEAA